MNSNLKPIDPQEIAKASIRIKPYIKATPIFSSSILNELLGHEILFKVEALQKTGAFKIRGALNYLLSKKEQDILPEKIVAFSSGNHAQAVALAGKLLKLETKIILPEFVSAIKQQATRSYGATVINTKTRLQAETEAAKFVEQGYDLIHPYDDDEVICGQGTSCFEALQTGIKPDAIFATCGGGGWLSGSYLANKLLGGKAKIYGVEPLQANDATRSYKANKIISYRESPETIADGARTLSVCPRSFAYLKKLDGFFEIAEADIIYWTQWLCHLLKVTIEPSSALAMAGAFSWLKTEKQKRKVLVLISGGNISGETYHKIWSENQLNNLPKIS